MTVLLDEPPELSLFGPAPVHSFGIKTNPTGSWAELVISDSGVEAHGCVSFRRNMAKFGSMTTRTAGTTYRLFGKWGGPMTSTMPSATAHLTTNYFFVHVLLINETVITDPEMIESIAPDHWLIVALPWQKNFKSATFLSLRDAARQANTNGVEDSFFSETFNISGSSEGVVTMPHSKYGIPFDEFAAAFTQVKPIKTRREIAKQFLHEWVTNSYLDGLGDSDDLQFRVTNDLAERAHIDMNVRGIDSDVIQPMLAEHIEKWRGR